ncbi:hypothetical protein NHX12_003319, partial [Muraenolepis orangiensis]
MSGRCRMEWAVSLSVSHRLPRKNRVGNTSMSSRCRRPDWYLNKVTLRVTDVNDNVPEWSMEPHPYLAVVSPEAGPGTLVYQLQARDGDQGEGGD